MRGLVAFCALAGCGRIEFSDVTDARPDAVPPGFCATATFSNPPASSLHDDFSVDPFTDRWSPVNPMMPCIVQTGGELVATPDSQGLFCHAYTIGDVHLTCDAITVRVPEVTSPAELGIQTFMYAYVPAVDTSVAVIVEGGGLQIGVIGKTGEQLAGSVFDPTQDRWWRLREHDGELAFDAAVDGIAWRELMRAPTPLSLDHVTIALGAGTYKPVGPPGQARFRCYNVPPPCN
ncbi:MAG TPA: hypothetical protein VMZ53_12920 [Kofleriaceae bacterium]|nr:hypothetical protein [Kofleriaceae bacterium]